MHMVFVILRIIVLILAILIGILLLLSLLVLTVPVRYLIHAKKEREWYGKIRMTWLLRFFSLTIEYKEDQLVYRLRLLGIPVFRSKESDEKRGVKYRKAKKKGKNRKKRDSVESTGEPSEKKDVENPNRVPATVRVIEDVSEGIRETVLEDEDDVPPKREGRFKRFWTTLRVRWKGFLKTWKGLRDRKYGILGVLFYQKNKAGWNAIKREILLLLKHGKPKTFRMRIRFGLGDPCGTGLALGALGVLYAYVGGGFQVEPDFENRVLEGYLYTKGRIRFLKVVLIGLRLYKDKEVMGLVKDMRKQTA